MDGIKDIKTVADLKAAFPDLTKQIEEAATDAERKRIQDIEDVAIAGYETIVADAKFKTPIASTFRTATTTRTRAARATLGPEDSERERAATAPTKWTRLLTSCSPT